MAIMSPEEADMVADLERYIQDERGVYYHIQSGIDNMRDFLWRERNGLIPVKELKAMYENEPQKPEGKGCGVFCHR